MKRILLILLMAMVCSPADAQRVDDESTPEGKIYVYKQVDGVDREMEIYFPKGHDASKKTVPGIILFHGGGWGGGSRVAFSYQCNYLASRGMVAATVTYRLRTKEDRAALTEGQSTKRVCIVAVQSVRSVERGAISVFQPVGAARLRVGRQDDAVQKALLLRRRSAARRRRSAARRAQAA